MRQNFVSAKIIFTQNIMVKILRLVLGKLYLEQVKEKTSTKYERSLFQTISKKYLNMRDHHGVITDFIKKWHMI